ncbi:hypothetical protein CR513_16546, partial [Mucuna pruriens]
MKSGIWPVMLDEAAEKIARLVAFQIEAGKEVPKEFPEMLKYCKLPKRSGISPLKLLLLMSRNVRLGRSVRPCGMEPLRKLSWIRTLVSEVQLARDGGSVLVNLLRKSMSLTSLLPLHTFAGIGPSSEFVETSSFCSNALEPSCCGRVPVSELLKRNRISSFGRSPIPSGICPVRLLSIRLSMVSSMSMVTCVGIGPVSSLSERSRPFRDFKFPMVGGIPPVNRFLNSKRVSSLVRFPSSGITLPEMLVLEMSKYLRLESNASSCGNVPVKLLYPISKCSSSAKWPSWGGSGPSKALPANAITWWNPVLEVASAEVQLLQETKADQVLWERAGETVAVGIEESEELEL